MRCAHFPRVADGCFGVLEIAHWTDCRCEVVIRVVFDLTPPLPPPLCLLTFAQDPDSQPIVVFPEGTTTNGTALTTFKSGAFVAGRPVQPILIRYR